MSNATRQFITIMETKTHITANEAASLLNVSTQTIKRWIQEKKFEGHKYKNRWYADTTDSNFQSLLTQASKQHNQQKERVGHTDHVDATLNNSVDKSIEFKTLTDQLQAKDSQLEKRDQQIDELLKQQDQAQQIIAMQQKSIDKLSEQNQLLLEASQEKKEKKISFWARLIGQRA